MTVDAEAKGPLSEGGSKAEDGLPPVTAEISGALANRLAGIIQSACEVSPGRPASVATKKLVAKRVPPKILSTFESMDEYPVVILDEAATILDRILAYPVTAQYRKHLTDAPPEVRRAWQIHSHSLRVGELYIVQDRTVAFLEFLQSVGVDCALPTTDCRKRFERSFKKAFDRRLLERHRLVHAHMRPSLTSRMIDLNSETVPTEKPAVIEALTSMLASIGPLFAKASESLGRKVPESIEEIEALHEEGALQEAAQMLNLFGEAALGTLNALSVSPSVSPVTPPILAEGPSA